MARASTPLTALMESIDKFAITTPPSIMISGEDTAVVESLIQKIRKRLEREDVTVEISTLSGEPGDLEKLGKEICNLPLFAPFRFYVIRQGVDLFKPISSSRGGEEFKKRIASYRESFRNISERTMMVIEYQGTPTKELLSIFGERLIHISTKALYADKMEESIWAIAIQHGVHLENDAVIEMSERIEKKIGVIEQTVIRLKDTIQKEKGEKITVADVREILFPAQGMDLFTFIDALFAGDHRILQAEFLKFNPASDNLFGVMKMILNRTDEIRKFIVGRSQRMNDSEIITFLGLQSRPPFVQKKILMRLNQESRRFNEKRLSKIYQFIVEFQIDSKSKIPAPELLDIFKTRLLENFFMQMGTT